MEFGGIIFQPVNVPEFTKLCVKLNRLKRIYQI
jgi:hypothetical protein